MRRPTLLTFAVIATSWLAAGCADTIGGDAIAAGPAGSTGEVSAQQSSTGGTLSPPPSTADSRLVVTPPATVTSSAAAPSATDTAVSTPAATSTETSTQTSTETKKTWKLPDTEPGRKKNAFGDLIAKPGDANGVEFTTNGQPDGELIFVVTKLTVDPKCVAGAAKSQRGHLLRIDLEVEPRDVSAASSELWSGTFSDQAWTAYDSKGTAQPGIDTDPADNCLKPQEYLPSVDSDLIARGTFVKGAVVLDVASPKGTAVLDLNTDGGWEFQYG